MLKSQTAVALALVVVAGSCLACSGTSRRGASKYTQKLVVLGFDGMDPHLLKKWMDEGKMPNISALARGGGMYPLQTTHSPESPTAWSNQTPFMRGFRQMMFSKIVPNLKRLGLLTPRVREAYADPGVVGVTAQIVEPETRSFGRFRSPIRRLLGREGTFTRFGYPRYPLQVERETDIEFMFGCFMSGRRDAVVEVGFDEGLPGYALAEDQDF